MGTETDQHDEAATEAGNRSILARILGWLRAGYPEGIPATDRFPVIAVLKRRLSDDDVCEIVEHLTDDNSEALADGVISHDEIVALIARVVKEQPTHDEIRRVSARLAAGGWPLAGPGSEDDGSQDRAGGPGGGTA